MGRHRRFLRGEAGMAEGVVGDGAGEWRAIARHATAGMGKGQSKGVSLVGVDQFAKAARAHWGIENSLHWCLDMTFREDYSRIRKDHSAENMAVVRHIALDILKQYPGMMSLARKRRRCAYDDLFLADLLRSVHA